MLSLYIESNCCVMLRDLERPLQSVKSAKNRGTKPNPEIIFRGRGPRGFLKARDFLKGYAKRNGFFLCSDTINGGTYAKD